MGMYDSVPGLYQSFQLYLKGLERQRNSLLKQDGKTGGGGDSKAELTAATKSYDDARRHRSTANDKWLDATDQYYKIKNRLRDAKAAPGADSALVLHCTEDLKQADSRKEALWNDLTSARSQEEGAKKIVEAAKAADQLGQTKSSVETYKSHLRTIAKESRSALEATRGRLGAVIRRCDEHQTALAQLRSGRTNQHVFHSQTYKNASERLQMACNDLIKFRAIEAVINLASLAAGMLAAISQAVVRTFAKVFCIGLWEVCKDHAVGSIADAGVAVHDSYYYIPVLTARNVQDYVKSKKALAFYRHYAKVMANQVQIKGFTEPGAKLFGNQYVVITEAFFDVLRADLSMKCWDYAISKEDKAVKHGLELIDLYRKRFHSDKDLVYEMEQVAGSLG